MKLRIYGEDGSLKPSIKEGYDKLKKVQMQNSKLKAEHKLLEDRLKESHSQRSPASDNKGKALLLKPVVRAEPRYRSPRRNQILL